MMKNSIQNINARLAIILFITILSISLTAILDAAVMPVYNRIQSVSDNLLVPNGVALDSKERIYIAESAYNRISVYSQAGMFIRTFKGLGRPLAVAVDVNDRILAANHINGNVEVYDADFSFLFKLGSGDGEFKKPCSIDTDSAGMIYVSDCKENIIKIFNPDGSLNYSFGISGSSTGQLNYPSGIAVDETAGEIIIADILNRSGMMGSYQQPRIQVFDMTGVYKRKFGLRGVAEGKLFRTTYLAVDSQSRLYITDAYEHVVQVFDNVGTSLGVMYDLASPVRTPLGITIGDNNKLFVTSQNTSKVEVYGLDNYKHMAVTPSSLSFQENEGGAASATQDVQISNAGTETLNWTASANNSWITLSQTSGTLVPSEVSTVGVGVDIAGFTAGTYTGSIDVLSDTGALETVVVTLTIIQAPLPELTVSPSSLTYVSINGSLPPSQVLSIGNTGAGTLGWTASADKAWMQLDKNSGMAPDMINVSVDPTSLSEGTHTGNIIIDAGNAINSPVMIPVTFEVIIQTGAINVTTNIPEATFTISGTASYSGGGTNMAVTDAPVGVYVIVYGDVLGYITPASEIMTLPDNSSISFNGQYMQSTGSINVTTNRSDATFTIEGPASYTGSGTSWSNADVPEGTYVITYGNVSGYFTPASQTLTLQRDSYIDFTGQYITIEKSIIVGQGPGQLNTGIAKVFNSDGTQTFMENTFQPYNYGINVTTGDIDGDGFDELISAPGKDPDAPADIKVFDRNGNELYNLNIYAFDYNTYLYGATVASADFDGDGHSDVIAGTGADKSNPAYVKIFTYDPLVQKLVDTGINLYPYNKVYGVNVTAGDVDGDGQPELITSPGPGHKNMGVIKIWDIDTSLGTGQWNAVLSNEFTVQSEYKYSVTIASGDLDGDGFDEIITGDGPHSKASDVIRVYDQNGSLLTKWQAGTALNGYGANVASGDLDNDGIAEIVVAPGPGSKNQAHVKVFDMNGIIKTDFYPFNTKYGATVAVGYFGIE